MFGQHAWGTHPWATPEQPTGENFIFPVSGGVVVGGTTALLIRDCACNTIVFPVRGGVFCGGSATIVDTTITGGVVCGGSCLIETDDPFDGYAGFWLLDESGNGTEDEYEDLTRFSNDGTGGGGSAEWTPTQDDGIFCRNSQHFDGNDYIVMDADSLTSTQAISVSLWAKIDADVFFQPRTFFSRGAEIDDGDVWTFQFGHTHLNQLIARVNTVDPDTSEAAVEYVQATTRLERGRWYHVAAEWEPRVGLKVYLNGVLQASKAVTATTLQPNTEATHVGRWNTGQTPRGNIQDVRLRGDAPGAEWFLTEYQSTCGVPDWLTVGDEIEL